MRDLDLTTLRLFVAVCETQNIARAGEQQHIVASAISKRLAQLEETVGRSLLDRRRRGVAPTAAGEIVLTHARAMLAAADRVARDMADFGSGIRGQVRLLATVSSMAESLPDDIAAFLQIPGHQDVGITIEESLSIDVVRSLREGSAPLAICWDAADLEGFQTRPYRADHLAAIVHGSHPLARADDCAFAQTLDHRHIGMPAQTAVQTMLNRHAAILGRRIDYRAVVSTFDAALRCVRANLGLAIIPQEIAELHECKLVSADLQLRNDVRRGRRLDQVEIRAVLEEFAGPRGKRPEKDHLLHGFGLAVAGHDPRKIDELADSTSRSVVELIDIRFKLRWDHHFSSGGRDFKHVGFRLVHGGLAGIILLIRERNLATPPSGMQSRCRSSS